MYTSWILPSSGEISENIYYMLNTKDIAEIKEYKGKVERVHQKLHRNIKATFERRLEKKIG